MVFKKSKTLVENPIILDNVSAAETGAPEASALLQDRLGAMDAQTLANTAGIEPVPQASKAFTEIAHDIRKNARIFQSIIDVGNLLEEMGSVENALLESKARLAVSQKEELVSTENLKDLKREINLLTSTRAEHHGKIDHMLATASDQAKEIVAKATAASNDLMESAKAVARQAVEAAEARALEISAATDSAIIELDMLNDAIDAGNDKKSALEGEIAALKSKFN